MVPWLVVVVFMAGINLGLFLAVRGRWGRLTPVLGLAALLGAVVGDTLGRLTGLEPLRIGQFHLVSGSIGAQLAMTGAVLLAVLVPAPAATRTPAGRSNPGRHDAEERDR